MTVKLSNILLVFSLWLFIDCKTGSVVEQPDFINEESGKKTNRKKQDDTVYTYFDTFQLEYTDKIYVSSIKTPVFFKTGFDLSPPVIGLNSPETVTLSFDDLDGTFKDLYYSIVHCDANWNPSDLMESEYLDGFFTYQITEHKYSFNTLTGYMNYQLTLPNDKTKFRKSGNYLLKVYANNDQEQLVMTRRFMIYEDQCGITPTLRRSSNVDDRTIKQELDLTINTMSLAVANPYSDIKVVILQNNRWDNFKKDLKPTFIRDKELVYDLDEPNIFNGGNEFRFFDLKSITYRTQNVAKVIRDTVPWSVLLLNDEKRPYKKYSTLFDINGKFLIKNDDATNSNTEADYFNIHFYLPYDEPLTGGDIYIFGQLSDWQLKDEFKLQYNYRTNRYEKVILLKQGFYNYEYVFVGDTKKEPDESVVEGSHYDTENNYTILVYYYDIKLDCDRLVGIRQFNTIKG